MVDVWKGSIALHDGRIIQGEHGPLRGIFAYLTQPDIGLAALNPAFAPSLSTTTLRFLATVDTAKIPLYLSAGPSYDVWTTSEETEQWFESILLSKPAAATVPISNAATRSWWDTARSQSPVGILVQVEAGEGKPSKPRVTEILFYGTIAAPSNATLPSSSPEQHDASLPELRVHALPLSSDLLYQQAEDAPPSPTHSIAEASSFEAQFLAPSIAPSSAPGSPKRKRDLFEEATIANKKSRGKGGIGVAAAAARGSESQNPAVQRRSLSIDTKASPHADFRPPSANTQSSRPGSRQLSRSPSVCSDTRPLSRKGTVDGVTRRSGLSRVDTISSQPEEPTTESRNKEALSKVVMAAMRMHGLQQRKRNHSRRASVAPGTEESQLETTAEDIAKDEEYKLVYHQTFRGAAFTFRQHMAEKPLHSQPDRLRDVVEKLLTVFLADPLSQPMSLEVTTEPVTTPGSKRPGVPGSSQLHASPFDLPSTARPRITRAKTDSHMYTGSPVNRKKFDCHDDMNVAINDH